MIESIPAVLDIPRNHGILTFVRNLSAHSDVWEKLWDALKHHPDVETFCPDSSHYRYVVAYTGSCIFAFAVGMSSIYVRLDPESQSRALACGALAEDVSGSDWVYFRLWQGNRVEPDIQQFVDLAYGYAKRDAA